MPKRGASQSDTAVLLSPPCQQRHFYQAWGDWALGPSQPSAGPLLSPQLLPAPAQVTSCEQASVITEELKRTTGQPEVCNDATTTHKLNASNSESFTLVSIGSSR